jgi:hypothetical protein
MTWISPLLRYWYHLRSMIPMVKTLALTGTNLPKAVQVSVVCHGWLESLARWLRTPKVPNWIWLCATDVVHGSFELRKEYYRKRG